MNDRITLADRRFRPYIGPERLHAAVSDLGRRLTEDYAGREPLFIAILNGCFMFAADLLKTVETDCAISFVKVASYAGTESTGQVRELIGLDEDLTGRHVVILEDIVDTGNTLARLLPTIEAQGPASLAICSLLLKPDAVREDLDVRYVGMEIPNDFIVGYGLDYDGLGRNLRAIYVVDEA